jgi:hypothetical protein
MLNKIFKEIKNLIHYYYLVNNTENTSNHETTGVDLEPSKVKKAETIDKTSKKINTTDAESFTRYNNQIREVQNRFNNYIDENNTNFNKNISDLNNNFTKIIPRRSSNIQIIENNFDNDEIPLANAGLFDINILPSRQNRQDLPYDANQFVNV